MRGNVQKIQENPRKSRKSKKTKEHQRKSKKIQENPLTCAFLAGGPISTFPLIGVTFGQHRKIQQFQEGARKLQEMQGICHKCVKCARECKGNPKNRENPRKSKKSRSIKENQRKSKKIQENPRKSKKIQKCAAAHSSTRAALATASSSRPTPPGAQWLGLWLDKRLGGSGWGSGMRVSKPGSSSLNPRASETRPGGMREAIKYGRPPAGSEPC